MATYDLKTITKMFRMLGCRLPGLLFMDSGHGTYCISGNIGGELNLAVWRSRLEPPN